jgi:hypothetical protein
MYINEFARVPTKPHQEHLIPQAPGKFNFLQISAIHHGERRGVSSVPFTAMRDVTGGERICTQRKL